MFKHKNPMMMMMKIAKICCAAVLALGLAACGSETVVAPVITPARPPTVAPAPDPSIEAMKLSDAKTAAMKAATDARTAAGDAQEAADTVAGLTGDESAQAMAAQVAADAADAAATAAEAASERAQADMMSADAEGEQTTAEAEQVKADDQLEVAQELERESELASAAVGQVLQVRDIAAAQEMAKAAAAGSTRPLQRGGPKVEGCQSEGGRSTGRSGPCHARADGFRRGGHAGNGGRNGCDRGRNGAG